MGFLFRMVYTPYYERKEPSCGNPQRLVRTAVAVTFVRLPRRRSATTVVIATTIGTIRQRMKTESRGKPSTKAFLLHSAYFLQLL